MNTNDKAPPAGSVEEDLSSEERVMHEEEAKRLAALKAASKRLIDGMAKVHSDDL